VPEAALGVRGLRPGPPLAGVLRAPGSKSLAQRALLCALVARGRSRLEGLPAGEDVGAACALVGALAEVARSGPGALEVEGRAAGELAGAALDAGESGTLARLGLGLLALAGRAGERFEIAARGSLQGRDASALRAALARAGVVFGGDGWPWRFRAAAPPRELVLERPASSQEASALLLALAAHEGERALELRGALPSEPYVAMTCAVLARFGAEVTRLDRPDGTRWAVRGPLRAPARALAIEPDASSAAVALCAAALSGGALLASGLEPDSPQGDVGIAAHLRAFGCRTQWSSEGLAVCGPPTRPAQLDLGSTPDLAPPLAVVAAAAAGARHGEAASELRGLGTLDSKESPRLELLVEGLRAAGWRAERTRDTLRVGGRLDADACAPLELDARGDHRMAFAFALLGLVRPNLRVRGAEAVAKSWPGFWEDLADLGARPAR
jgi:3-phosphoshikimate 1-carboxyvinyltransferase